jgi:hypothetical protein
MRKAVFAVWVSIFVATSALAAVPKQKRVILVVLENKTYERVLGSTAMPYLKSLAREYAYSTQYYANSHPSIGNYFWMTTGKNITNDNSYSGTVTVDNLARQMNKAGISWRVYAQSLPYVGYIGGQTGAYRKHHNPFAYFSDVRNSSTQRSKLRPLGDFFTDLKYGRLPRFVYILPDNRHNSHDCPPGMSSCSTWEKMRAADNFLRNTLEPLLNSSTFSNDNTLIITWDEAAKDDDRHGGGRILTVLVGEDVKRGYRSSGFRKHPSLLRTMEMMFGLPRIGAAQSATSLYDMFD